jgi:hypothetical protein
MVGPCRRIFERSEIADGVMNARCSLAFSRPRACGDAAALYADLAPEDCP